MEQKTKIKKIPAEKNKKVGKPIKNKILIKKVGKAIARQRLLLEMTRGPSRCQIEDTAR